MPDAAISGGADPDSEIASSLALFAMTNGNSVILEEGGCPAKDLFRIAPALKVVASFSKKSAAISAGGTPLKVLARRP